MENEKDPIPETTSPNAEEPTIAENGETLPEETSPPTETGSLEGSTLPSEKKPTPPWLRKGLTWAAAGLVFLILGWGLAYFLLFVPEEQARFEAEQQVNRQAEQIAALEADLTQTREQLQKTQAELEQTSEELKALQYSAVLTALQNNVSYARLALVTKDLLTARQELSSASNNLKKLIPMIGDKDIESALSERLATVRSSMTSDPEKSLEELRILAENLSRLEKP